MRTWCPNRVVNFIRRLVMANDNDNQLEKHPIAFNNIYDLEGGKLTRMVTIVVTMVNILIKQCLELYSLVRSLEKLQEMFNVGLITIQ